MATGRSVRSPQPGALSRAAAPRDGRRAMLVMALAALALTALLWVRTAKLTPGDPIFPKPWDHHMYIYMAVHGPFGFHIAPFCWRVLGPLVVWALPLGVRSGFEVVTFVSLWLTGVVVYLLGRAFRFEARVAWVGMVLFYCLGFATKFTSFDFWLTDPLAFLFAALAIYCIATGRDVGFAAALAAGVLTKESVIFVAPLYYSLNARKLIDGRMAYRTVALCLPAVAALAAVRVGIDQMNSDPSYVRTLPGPIQGDTIPHYTYGSVLHDAVSERLHHWPETLYKAVSSFGLLLAVLPLLSFRRSLSMLARLAPFLVLVYVQLAFALNTGRLLVFGFPAVILVGLAGVQGFMERRGVGARPFLALAAAFFVLQLVWTREWEPNVLVQLVVLALFLPFVFGWRPRRPRLRRANYGSASPQGGAQGSP